jgi:hypothetical protein
MTGVDAATGKIERAATARLETDREVEVKQSAIGLVRSETVTVNQAAVGAVLARGNVSVAQGGGRAFLAGGDLRISQGGGGMLVAGGGAEITQGGVGTMISLGEVRVSRGFVAIAVTPRLTVEEGGRVLAGIREVAIGAVVAGAVIGLVVTAAGRRGSRR